MKILLTVITFFLVGVVNGQSENRTIIPINDSDISFELSEAHQDVTFDMATWRMSITDSNGNEVCYRDSAHGLVIIDSFATIKTLLWVVDLQYKRSELFWAMEDILSYFDFDCSKQDIKDRKGCEEAFHRYICKHIKI